MASALQPLGVGPWQNPSIISRLRILGPFHFMLTDLTKAPQGMEIAPKWGNIKSNIKMHPCMDYRSHTGTIPPPTVIVSPKFHFDAASFLTKNGILNIVEQFDRNTENLDR